MTLFAPIKSTHQTSNEVRRSATQRRRGVLLINTGSPEKPDVPSVRKYLAEFLSDPLVIQLPTGLGWLQGTLGRLLARFRAPRSAEMYRRIWTDRGFPLKAIMEDQAAGLASRLPEGWRVFVAMRYSEPGIAAKLREIEAAGIEELVVVPMFPHFSRTTTGSVVQELYRALGHVGDHINVATRATWYDDIGYINSQARLIAEYAASHDLKPQDTHLLFSAHGLPVSYVKRGDPYKRHVERTIELVTGRLGWPADRMSLSYQSRLGPAEWLKPDTKERLTELSRANEKKVLVCPISFTVDCLESIEEVGLRYRESFESKGGRLYLCPALNDYEPFMAALKSLVLRGSQPMTSWGAETAPLLESKAEPTDGDLKSLVMIGASIESRVGPGRGPQLNYSDLHALCCVKKSHDEVHAFLQRIREENGAREALVWNTCQRFEFYGWLKNPDDLADRECVVARIRHQLFGNEPEGLGVNVLFGVEAWHHLMRTVVGLNSGLPGDKDITEQLQTAHRIALHAGTAGPRAGYLVEEAIALERNVRAKTGWGRYDPGYCFAAFSRIHESIAVAPADCRYVVIGGSTTSRSILETLSGRFDVPKRHMTLAYRGHKGGQLKLLRSAIGNGKRVRVHSYSERAVIDAIADADVVFFGIDRDEPVLDADDLRGIRDFTERPLTIVDFNTFGSTSGVEGLDGVTVWHAEQSEQEVGAYAEAMCAEGQFAQAVEEAEDWIERRLPLSAAPYLELPCMRNGEGARPACGECWRSADAGRALAGSSTP